MGQYFNPVFLNADNEVICALSPRDYGCGDGLFSHSRASNRLHYAVQALLSLDSGLRLVWAGDYADNAPDGSPSVYWSVDEHHFKRIAGLLDPECTKPTNMAAIDPELRNVYGVTYNLDKHEFIDNMALPRDDHGWQRTPLPRLTAEAGPTNGDDALGRWARDRLIYRCERPGAGWTDVTAA